jgi:hypothetical protein
MTAKDAKELQKGKLNAIIEEIDQKIRKKALEGESEITIPFSSNGMLLVRHYEKMGFKTQIDVEYHGEEIIKISWDIDET